MSDYDDSPYIVVERRGGSVAAFLWGAVLGAGAALLLAPRSGRETRQELADGARRLRETAEDRVRRVQDVLTDTIDTVRRGVTDRVDAARDAFDAGRSAARETRAELERRIRDVRATYESGRRASAEGEERPDVEVEVDLDVRGADEGQPGD